MKLSSVLRLVGLVLLVAAVAAVLVFSPQVKYELRNFLEWVRGLGWWGPFIFTAFYVVACVLFVPGSLLTLGAGFVFGVVVGTVTVSVASLLGASASFLLGRTLAREWVQKKVATSPKFQALDEAVKQQGFKVVLLTRLSPVFPFNLLNYAFGLTKVSFRDYVLASWIGMLPGTILYVYLGSTVGALADVATGNVQGGTAQKVLFWLGLAATVVVTVFVTRLARRALRAAAPPARAESPQQEGDVHG